MGPVLSNTYYHLATSAFIVYEQLINNPKDIRRTVQYYALFLGVFLNKKTP